MGNKSKNRFLEGVIWRFMSILFRRFGGILTTLILAKLLVPEDFGLVAVSSIFVGGLSIIRTVGMPSALICIVDDIDQAAPTVFTFLLFASFILVLPA